MPVISLLREIEALLVPECLLGPGTGDDPQGTSRTDLTSMIFGSPELLVEKTLSSSSSSWSSVLGTVVSCASGHELLLQGLSGGVCWASALTGPFDDRSPSLSEMHWIDPLSEDSVMPPLSGETSLELGTGEIRVSYSVKSYPGSLSLG